MPYGSSPVCAIFELTKGKKRNNKNFLIVFIAKNGSTGEECRAHCFSIHSGTWISTPIRRVKGLPVGNSQPTLNFRFIASIVMVVVAG